MIWRLLLKITSFFFLLLLYKENNIKKLAMTCSLKLLASRKKNKGEQRQKENDFRFCVMSSTCVCVCMQARRLVFFFPPCSFCFHNSLLLYVYDRWLWTCAMWINICMSIQAWLCHACFRNRHWVANNYLKSRMPFLI